MFLLITSQIWINAFIAPNHLVTVLLRRNHFTITSTSRSLSIATIPEYEKNDDEFINIDPTRNQMQDWPMKSKDGIVSRSRSAQKPIKDDGLWKKRKKRWVIVVDDEESIRSSVSDYLCQSGYQVTACSDAASALQLASNGMSQIQKTVPDAIITDVRMPGDMDGLGFLNSIRLDTQLVNIPVILLTAKGKTEDRIAGYDAGADAYLPKPFDPEELVAMLDSVIDRHESLNPRDGQHVPVTVEALKEDVQEIKALLKHNFRSKELVTPQAIYKQVDDENIIDTVTLSIDEQKVLYHLCRGWTNKEIAVHLNYSIRRVEQHLTSMYRKTECSSRTELVRWAIDSKLVDL